MTLAYKLTSRGRGRLLMDEFFNMLNTFTLLQALWRFAMQGRKTGAFVVTSKKGGGTSTSAVLPHFVMLAGSLLAINWSLLGLGFGVSEDRFGAGIAIFWTLYNMALVVGVIRLALRPSQKRDTSRFRASFAATTPATTTTPLRVGVTADLSEGGCRLLWPERLKETGIHRVALHLPAGVVHLDAAVISRHPLTRDGWYPHGVCFVNPDAARWTRSATRCLTPSSPNSCTASGSRRCSCEWPATPGGPLIADSHRGRRAGRCECRHGSQATDGRGVSPRATSAPAAHRWCRP